MYLKAVVIEDEAASRANLKRLLADIPEVYVQGYASNGIEGLKMIKELNPDLIFLDINLPGYDGFELLSKLEQIPNIIFVTAFNEYAVRAFESNCIDYLLKPVTKDRLKNAVAKIIAFDGHEEPMDYDTIKKLLSMFKMMKRFPVKINDEVMVFTEDMVFAFLEDGINSKIVTKENTYDFQYTFKELVNRLDCDVFQKSSDSIIVNIGNIIKIKGKKIVLGDDKQTVLKSDSVYLRSIKGMWKEKSGY